MAGRSIRGFILASASPRRQQLLASAGLDFEVEPSRAVEEHVPGEDPAHAAMRLARAKAFDVFARRPGSLVLAADTVVAVDDRILGKPKSPAEAEKMLELLSGRAHRVVTGVCLLGPDRDETFHVSTEVVFRPLGAEEIRAYVKTGEPMDKAGAYAIQGGAAGFVREIHGSYTNVVGLPLAECLERLRSGAHRRG
ncbi:MAG: Maf family protein [Pseudomonadota bacterium]|nr:MAG: septum formation protein Maf [Pseudomonadota bacterium]